MKSYLEVLDLWEVMEEDYEVSPLPDNPTMIQIKNQKEKKNKKGKDKVIIMTLISSKSIWDYLKEEYARDEQIRDMQVLNLMREFEL
ncbi:hypothetical protein CR513_07467, partial [Mucuna pruriens]